MKKLGVLLGFLICFAGHANGTSKMVEEGIETISDVADATITVSSAPWTQLLATKMTHRDGIIINVPEINTGNLYIHISSTTNTPLVSTNTAVIEIRPSDTERVIQLDEDLTLFGITTHTTEETVYIQQFRQVK